MTDLALHFDANSSFRARQLARIGGMYGKLGWSWLERFFWIRVKRAATESFDQILRWDFERVIIAHGKVMESDAKKSVSRALTV